MIYLDNAATTMIKPAQVGEAVVRAMRSMASPGRGGHPPAMRAAEAVYDCRCAAAALFKVKAPERVVFTMNATHALNIAIASLARRGTRTVISGFEHNSVTRPLRAAGAEVSVAGRRLFDAAAVLEDFWRLIPGSELVVCTHVSNVFGFILPIYEIAELCARHCVPLIVDASQSAGILELDMERLGAVFIAMPGHKALYGPQGTGMLLCGREGAPLLYGGSGSDSVAQRMPDYLPDRLEAGTHNVCGIAGLRAGIDFVTERGLNNIFSHEQRLTKLMEERLEGSGLELFRGGAGEQCGVLSVRHGGIDSEALSAALAEKGVCVRAGLHCAPTAHESAGTLETGTVRFSFSAFTTEKQVLEACAALRGVCRELL